MSRSCWSILGPDELSHLDDYRNDCSGENTLEEIADVYERVKKRKVRINKNGTVEELRSRALQARRRGTRKKYWEYIGWFYQLYAVDRTYVLGELYNHRL